MEQLPEECLHLIYIFCFDDIIKDFPQPKYSYAINFDLIDPLPTLTIKQLLNTYTKHISLYYIESKYKHKCILENSDNKRENLFIKYIQLQENFDLIHIIETIKYFDKSAQICFRNQQNNTIQNDRNIFLEICNEFNENIILGLLIDWKQYI